MARNAIKSDFRSSKMAAGGHFEKKRKVAIWSEMASNAIKSDFWSSKMAARSHFVKKKSCVLIWNREKCDRKWFSVIQNGHRQPFCEKRRVAYWSEMARKAIKNDLVIQNGGGGAHHNGQPVNHSGDIHSICPWPNTPILVDLFNWPSFPIKMN